MKDNRYNRQELIQGWDQDKLEKARVLIVGSGPLAQYTAISLTALGIGKIDIHDNALVSEDEGFLTRNARRGSTRVHELEKKLNEINPKTKVSGSKYGFIEESNKPDILIDLTNSRESKDHVLQRGSTQNTPTILASANKTGGDIYIFTPDKQRENISFYNYEGQTQGHFPSEVLGGMIAEEARKILMPLNEDDLPVNHLFYHLTSSGLVASQRFRPFLQNACHYKHHHR